MSDGLAIEPLFSRRFLLLVLAHFLQGMGYASMLLFPLYLDHLGATRTEIGATMAFAAIGSITSRPFAAYALDRVGRKWALLAGTIILVSTMLLLAFVTEISPLVYTLRFVMGAGIGTLWTGYFTFASDLVPAHRRTEGLALFGLSGLIPLILNPFVGELGIAHADLRWFFPIVGAATLFSLVPLAFIREPARETTGARFELRGVVAAMRERSLQSSWLAISAIGGLVSMFMAFATVTAEHRGVARPAALWFTYALGAVVIRTTGGRLPDRIGPSRLVPPAIIACALAALTSAYGESLSAFLFAGALAGIGHGIGFPVITSQVVSRTPTALRGTALSTLTALWELSGLVLSPTFGVIADHAGDRAMFVAAALFGATTIALWWSLEKRGA